MMTRIALIPLLFALAASPPAGAQDTPQAFVGARILPIAGPEIPRGTLIFHRGRIVAVGAADAVEIPDGSAIRDVDGMVLMPGLVCSHSHIAGVAGGDGSAPMHPDVRVLDAIDVRAPSIQRAQAGGLTTVNLMPGSGHLLSGQTVYVKLKDGRTVDDLAIRTADGRIAGGMKMANGTNSQREPPFPETRARSAALVRARFVAAQEYRAKQQRAERARAAADRAGPNAAPPERDLGLEALLEVLDGKRVVHFHTHRHDDILTVLRLREEFGFRVVLHHLSDGWKVVDEIATANVPCSVIVVDSPGGKLEAMDLRFETPGLLHRAGILVGLHTDDWITDSRVFLRSAALAHRAGMERDAALAAVTLSNARILELDDRIGSLEPGKDADFALLDGDPLSIYTRVRETWIEGAKVFDLSVAEDRLYAEGGFGAGDERAFGCGCLGPEGGP